MNPASQDEPRLRARVHAWLQLVRPPNLFTVPGDPVAGMLLALPAAAAPDGRTMTAAAAASLAVYAAGLIDNDLADHCDDLQRRPERPLPAGRVSARAARAAAGGLFTIPFAIGLALRLPLAWLAVHGALLIAVLAYNRIKRRCAPAGFMLMGLCRALSLVSGAAATGAMATGPAVPIAAAVWWIYIAALTRYAAEEAGDPRRQIVVGRLIRGMLPLQAAACLFHPHGRVAAAGLVLLWFAAGRAGKVFYGS